MRIRIHFLVPILVPLLVGNVSASGAPEISPPRNADLRQEQRQARIDSDREAVRRLIQERQAESEARARRDQEAREHLRNTDPEYIELREENLQLKAENDYLRVSCRQTERILHQSLAEIDALKRRLAQLSY